MAIRETLLVMKMLVVKWNWEWLGFYIRRKKVGDRGLRCGGRGKPWMPMLFSVICYFFLFAWLLLINCL